jgi:hypothetical protein
MTNRTPQTTPTQKLAKYRQAIAYDANQGLPNNAAIPKLFSNINWTASPNKKKLEKSDPANVVTRRTYQLHLRNRLSSNEMVAAKLRLRA